MKQRLDFILILGAHSSSEALLPRAAAALGQPAAGGLPALGLGAPRARLGAFSAACAHQTELSKLRVASPFKDTASVSDLIKEADILSKRRCGL